MARLLKQPIDVLDHVHGSPLEAESHPWHSLFVDEVLCEVPPAAAELPRQKGKQWMATTAHHFYLGKNVIIYVKRIDELSDLFITLRLLHKLTTRKCQNLQTSAFVALKNLL